MNLSSKKKLSRGRWYATHQRFYDNGHRIEHSTELRPLPPNFNGYLLVSARKACRLVGIGTSWRTEAVSVVIHGSSETRDQSFNPGPAIATGLLAEIFWGRGRNNDFAFIATLGWILIRVTPECLPLFCRGAGGELESDARPDNTAAI